MNREQVKIAYLRGLERTTQCDLTFWLTIKHSKYGSIDQEIKSVRQFKDNVASLLTHTENKIIKIFQDNGNQEVNGDKIIADLNISFSRNDRKFAGSITCEELLQCKSKVRFTIFGTTYRVIVNAPLIFILRIPNHIYANSCVKPLRLQGLHLNKRLSKYKWSRSKDKKTWTDVFYEISYNTTMEDVNHYLKFTCSPYSMDLTPGPEIEMICENPVDVLPGTPTTSIPIEYRKKYTSEKLTNKNIRVVSYNILAERYTDDKQFVYCDPKYLTINYRKQLVLNEIMNYKADIICLQEVDLDHYHTFFKGHFKNNAYASVFYKKGHTIPEGLCFIYDKNRFKMLECRHIVLAQELKTNNLFRDVWNFMKKHQDAKDLFIKQHTSLFVATLKLVETNDILVVANTHLYYHREAGHIRLLQIVMALRYIKQQCQSIKARENGKISVIFCGDFNSRPDTAVYQYITEAHVKLYEQELEKIDGGQSSIFQHNFKFTSACGTPEFTNYTDDFKGCLDYIFCEDHIEVTQTLPFPPEEELAKDVAIPNKYFPSDHLALVTDLKL